MMLLRVRCGRATPRPSWGGCQLSQAALPLVCAYTISVFVRMCVCIILSMYFASIRPVPGMRTREMVPTEWGVPAVRFGRDQTTVLRATASGSLPSGVWRSFPFLCLHVLMVLHIRKAYWRSCPSS